MKNKKMISMRREQLKGRIVEVLIKGKIVQRVWTSNPDSPTREMTTAEKKLLKQDSLTTLN